MRLSAAIACTLAAFGLSHSAGVWASETPQDYCYDETRARPDPRPDLPKTGVSVRDFVPWGWKLFDVARGDLNRDGKTDLALVIQRDDPKGIITNPDGLGVGNYDCNPRALIVALSRRDEVLGLAAVDNALIPDWDAPTIDDPYQEISIDGGALVVPLTFFANAGAWETFNRTFRFRWEDKARDMKLIGYDKIWVHRGSGDMKRSSVNYLSKKRQDAEGNIADEEGEPKWVWRALPKAPAPVLGQIGNGFEFEP